MVGEVVPQGEEIEMMVGSIDSQHVTHIEDKSPTSRVIDQETDVLLGVSSVEMVSLSVSDHAETEGVGDNIGGKGSDSLLKEEDTVFRQRLKDCAVYTLLLGLAGVFTFVTFAIIYRECIFPSYKSAPFVLVNSGAQDSSLLPVGQDRTLLNALAAKGLGTPENPIRFGIFGDSVVTSAMERDHFVEVFEEQLRDHGVDLHFHISNLGSAGCRMDCTWEKVTKMDLLGKYNPHVAILMGNSDITDTWDPRKFQWESYKNAYRDWLKETIEVTQAYVGKHNFAIANPTLVTEGPWFRPIRMRNLDGHIADIEVINRELANQYPGVVQIEQVAAMKSIMVSWWKLYSLYNTRDGSHLSKLGVKLFAANCVRFLLS